VGQTSGYRGSHILIVDCVWSIEQNLTSLSVFYVDVTFDVSLYDCCIHFVSVIDSVFMVL